MPTSRSRRRAGDERPRWLALHRFTRRTNGTASKLYTAIQPHHHITWLEQKAWWLFDAKRHQAGFEQRTLDQSAELLHRLLNFLRRFSSRLDICVDVLIAVYAALKHSYFRHFIRQELCTSGVMRELGDYLLLAKRREVKAVMGTQNGVDLITDVGAALAISLCNSEQHSRLHDSVALVQSYIHKQDARRAVRLVVTRLQQVRFAHVVPHLAKAIVQKTRPSVQQPQGAPSAVALTSSNQQDSGSDSDADSETSHSSDSKSSDDSKSASRVESASDVSMEPQSAQQKSPSRSDEEDDAMLTTCNCPKESRSRSHSGSESKDTDDDVIGEDEDDAGRRIDDDAADDSRWQSRSGYASDHSMQSLPSHQQRASNDGAEDVHLPSDSEDDDSSSESEDSSESDDTVTDDSEDEDQGGPSTVTGAHESASDMDVDSAADDDDPMDAQTYQHPAEIEQMEVESATEAATPCSSQQFGFTAAHWSPPAPQVVVFAQQIGYQPAVVYQLVTAATIDAVQGSNCDVAEKMSPAADGAILEPGAKSTLVKVQQDQAAPACSQATGPSAASKLNAANSTIAENTQPPKSVLKKAATEKAEPTLANNAAHAQKSSNRGVTNPTLNSAPQTTTGGPRVAQQTPATAEVMKQKVAVKVRPARNLSKARTVKQVAAQSSNRAACAPNKQSIIKQIPIQSKRGFWASFKAKVLSVLGMVCSQTNRPKPSDPPSTAPDLFRDDDQKRALLNSAASKPQFNIEDYMTDDEDKPPRAAAVRIPPPSVNCSCDEESRRKKLFSDTARILQSRNRKRRRIETKSCESPPKRRRLS